MGTKFGRQPGYLIVQRQQRTIKSLAEELGVSQAHLVKSFQGHIRPNDVVRHDLPRLLDCELGDLFTAESLSQSSAEGRGRKPAGAR